MADSNAYIFDTNVQKLKYKTLRELIKKVDNDDLINAFNDIPKTICKGPKATLRCCIYKERAIIGERIKMALGGNKEDPNIVEVIDSACDECPIDGIMVTPACRGCITHKCKDVCPRDAITIVDKRSVINKDLCIECGKCTKVCPYSAIILQRRPCVVSCKVGAISMDKDKKAVIDSQKCVGCGACVYQCPFGAITDKSYILETIDILKKSENNANYKVFAVIAPSIVSQFKYARIEQVVSGIKKLGFYDVVEAALGADITLHKEADEYIEKGVLLSSCCPSYVMYVEKFFPELVPHISSTGSPMVQVGRLIKSTEPNAKVVFIGPCSSKKLEYKLEKTGGAIDSVISFEELQAFLDARDIDISTLKDTELNNASYYGRIFAKSGGITEGLTKIVEERGGSIKPIALSGLEMCKMNLLKLKMKRATETFFEGMACEGGCINGALCLNHGAKNAIDVDKYGKMAKEATVENSVKLWELTNKT